MPTPVAITNMGAAAHNCGTTQLQIPNPRPHAGGQRATLTRSFVVYLELCMQAKHDGRLQGYCHGLRLVPRPTAGTQVPGGGTAQNALAGFYVQRARTAASAVSTQMIAKWQAGTTFVPGQQVNAAIQRNVQADGYRYEISYWYDGTTIYVLFHCYP